MRRTFKGFKRKKGGYRQFTNEILKITNFICDKKTYLTKKDARIALDRIRNEPDELSEKKPIRSYECNKCSGWHLTSKTIEEFKEHKSQWDKNKIIEVEKRI